MNRVMVLLILGMFGIFTFALVKNFGVNAKNVVAIPAESAVDHGNGVYFFPDTRVDFGKSLSIFIESHSELEVITITSSATSAKYGYYVVMKKRGKD